MESYSHEAKLVNGIPALSETDVESILHKNIKRKIPFTKISIENNLQTLREIYAESIRPESVVSHDHQPCGECGGIDFRRTGTCFVCLTCGASQGCS